ncbi:hypothetical protein Zm00014a_034986 [Zea mays]|uniref:Uncharacterized protein n=1 Tax=Zea mays TaxID=4577 RepID=A0A3L6DNC6_MAIZE|nr:hypothetical protein Zm00014a_034986 [Zea mays]
MGSRERITETILTLVFLQRDCIEPRTFGSVGRFLTTALAYL